MAARRTKDDVLVPHRIEWMCLPSDMVHGGSPVESGLWK